MDELAQEKKMHCDNSCMVYKVTTPVAKKRGNTKIYQSWGFLSKMRKHNLNSQSVIALYYPKLLMY